MAGDVIADAVQSIREPDAVSRQDALALQSRLTKPAGALGRLEELAVWAAGVARTQAPLFDRKVIVVAAADHGVAAEGVSAYPQDVTWQMVMNFLRGGAAVNVLARQCGADVRVVDAGVRRDFDDAAVRSVKVRRGSDSMTRGPAMPRDEAERLVARGIDFARELRTDGFDAIALGDMGIGNTTAAAAMTAVFTGAPPRMTCGRGTGIDDAAFAAKVAAIERAIEVNEPDASDGIDVLAKVGGCELAFLAGVAIGAASSGLPVLLDGYPTTASALVAASMAPANVAYMVASHVSAEPGHRIALDHLGLRPLLDLEMRLGEGSGAALAFSVLDAALRLPREMATFDSAGVSRSTSETRPEA
ncbi:MAG TPA: nicotinate-nucleotide--dimethylbenzimidazole phosphoribosyltransferase [Dehalococcoidia bacterium]|nr:nicotinate-nucleotide--dimethylbenzimidazole phosphoribosyltransferase [Dehalococcoidia bacterium]